MTFLETVLAVILLGMAAATMSMSVGTLERTSNRQAQRLGAAELGNRLMLQYLDDRKALPDPGLPIQYDKFYYRWSLDVSQVRAKADPAAGEDRKGVEQALSRLTQVSFRVWLGEDSGGSLRFDRVVPRATLTRLIDPLLPHNPHAIEKLMTDPQRVMDLISGLQNIQQGRDILDDGSGDGGNEP